MEHVRGHLNPADPLAGRRFPGPAEEAYSGSGPAAAAGSAPLVRPRRRRSPASLRLRRFSLAGSGPAAAAGPPPAAVAVAGLGPVRGLGQPIPDRGPLLRPGQAYGMPQPDVAGASLVGSRLGGHLAALGASAGPSCHRRPVMAASPALSTVRVTRIISA